MTKFKRAILVTQTYIPGAKAGYTNLKSEMNAFYLTSPVALVHRQISSSATPASRNVPFFTKNRSIDLDLTHAIPAPPITEAQAYFKPQEMPNLLKKLKVIVGKLLLGEICVPFGGVQCYR